MPLKSTNLCTYSLAKKGDNLIRNNQQHELMAFQNTIIKMKISGILSTSLHWN